MDPELPVKYTHSSTVKSPLPNSKLGLVGTITWSPVPSKYILPAPYFLTAVDILVSPTVRILFLVEASIIAAEVEFSNKVVLLVLGTGAVGT